MKKYTQQQMDEALEAHTATLLQRVGELLGENTNIHKGGSGDEATWESAQNELRNKIRKGLCRDTNILD